MYNGLNNLIYIIYAKITCNKEGTMKKKFILFSTILLMISLGGCSMFINRKAIAEKALQNQYGEEFVAYHTWDHGGDSFRASMYPKDDESIKFETHVTNDARIITDYYTEKIVGKEIIKIIKPYIDEFAEESAYFATVPIQKLGYTSKEEVSIEDFYIKAEKDESDWPYIYICINPKSIYDNISYEDEYEVYRQIVNSADISILEEKKITLYFLADDAFTKMKNDFNNMIGLTSTSDPLEISRKKVRIKSKNGVIGINLDEYIQKRKEIDEHE